MNKCKRNYYPFNYEGNVKIENNKVVLQHDTLGHLCGYVAFNKKDIPQAWHGSYDAPGLQGLNIHGGLTFCDVKEDEVIFGFDCAHLDDDENPDLLDVDYVMGLTKQMEQQLIAYKQHFTRFKRLTKNSKLRGKILDEVRGTATVNCEFGFGTMIGLLAGEIT